MDIQKIKVVSVRPPQLNNYNPDAWGFYTHPGWGVTRSNVEKHVKNIRQKSLRIIKNENEHRHYVYANGCIISC